MSTDANAPAGGTPPAAPQAPTQTQTQEPAPGEPGWLKPRLEQATLAGERKVLEQLGLSSADLDTAKKAIEAAKAAAEAEKTAAQKAAEADQRAREAMTRAERAEATNREHAARMMAVLSEERQAAVKEIAGDDPLLQLRAIHALGKTWAADAEKAAAAKPAPATTAPPPNAPGGSDPNSPPDHSTVYQSLSNNPFARAVYGAQHPEAYAPRK